MTIVLAATLGGVLVVAGMILGVVALIGTSRPPRPANRLSLALRRLWRASISLLGSTRMILPSLITPMRSASSSASSR